MNDFFALLKRLATFRVTEWAEDSSVHFYNEEHAAPLNGGANIVSSLRTDVEPAQPAEQAVPSLVQPPTDFFADRLAPAPENGRVHALLLDLDVPAYLVPSSTPGHSHLYVDVEIPEGKLFRLLDALSDAGVIQTGYAGASQSRGGTALRLPWVKKDDEDNHPFSVSEGDTADANAF